MVAETAVPLAKTRFLTWEKQEHLVKLAILIIAAVLCEYKHKIDVVVVGMEMNKKSSTNCLIERRIQLCTSLTVKEINSNIFCKVARRYNMWSNKKVVVESV